MMNTLELYKKAHDDEILKNEFIGVYPLDKFPQIYHFPSAFILNLDNSNSAGSHWVALYFPHKGKCEYFDSFGRIAEKCILKNISKYVKCYTYNNIRVQNFWSISCGQLCIYFLLWRCRGISFKDIIKSMTSDDFIEGFIDSL